jgi:phenylpropionate dioxygenase-like ring-hydroxylating dioxygenase large terminal subunit
MIPNRWYPILESTALRRKPVALQRFSRPLVAWRDADANARVFPAHCPHRRAHLAQGRIVDGTLACPWHAFRFDGSGRCVAAPCEGASGRIPSGLHAEPLPVTERHGLVWAWYGEPQTEYPEIAFFDDVELALERSSQASYTLPYHYTRMVETNLDIHHTPIVHGSVIPGLANELESYEAHLDGDRIFTSGVMARRGNRRGLPFRADAILPNLGMIELTGKLRLVVAATPIDDAHSWVWFRYYQDYTTLPGLRWLVAWLAVQSELRVVQKQDWRVFSRMIGGSVDDVDYHLVRADLGIALYLKRRRELLGNAAHG